MLLDLSALEQPSFESEMTGVSLAETAIHKLSTHSELKRKMLKALHNKFGTDERFRKENDQLEREARPGPEIYDPPHFGIESKNRRIPTTHIVDRKPAIKLPFTLNNPLNYVKPFTVNIYCQPSQPSVGDYNPRVQTNRSNPAPYLHVYNLVCSIA